MQNFRNLLVWQKAHELALLTYKVTNDFPRDEIFGLRNMMRKTSIDVPAFIAEGCGKSNDADFSRSMNAAIATSNRLEYYAIMARDLEFFGVSTHEDYENRLIEVRRMMTGFNRKLSP
ncbi:MAG: four helix bundle protein [Pyrinomonadaceae bacterium]